MNILTRFLIYCSGADINILKDSPTYEQTKFACIGGTVLFTGIFASVAGGYALYRVFYIEPDFVNNAWVYDNTPVYYGIAFGIFWGLLIFNLDRFIVSSMKKSNFFLELFMAMPRFLLAAIISLVIAKPLEVKLFENRLAGFIQQEKVNQDSIYSNKILNVFNVKEKEKDYTNVNKELTDIQNLLGKDPQDSAFKNLQANHRNCMSRFRSLERSNPPQIQNLNNRLSEIDRPISYLDGNPQYDERTQNEINQIRAEIIRLNNQISSQEENCVSIAAQITRRRSANQNNLKIQQSQKSEEKERKEKSYTDSQTESQKEIALIQRANKRSYSENFITQLEALGRLTAYKKNIENDKNTLNVDNTMYWTSILLMLLFFVIETAPVLVKLISPKGPYDIVLRENERYIKESTKDDTDFQIKMNRRNIKSIYKSDKSANNKVINKVSEAQIEIAENLVNKWKTEEMHKMQSASV